MVDSISVSPAPHGVACAAGRRRWWARAGGVLACVLLLSACVREDDAFTRVSAWTLPTSAEAAQPDLTPVPGGGLLLSWLEPRDGGGHRLRLARSDDPAREAWQTSTVAEGGDWFVNWADTPHVFALADGSLWAHWLRSTGPARMDYGIDLVRSGDGGRTWSPPRLVNRPGVLSDHGFVSFWAHDDDTLGIAWLDSRLKAPRSTDTPDPAGDGHAHAHPAGPAAGAMSLRAALYGPDAHASMEWPLDPSTCDCCPTASAMTDRGPVVVYRGREADEVRDMRLVRYDGERQGWTAPRPVHADGWRIPGCPVNGPAVAADGTTVWVAWYTEGDGEPALRIARSADAGDRFAPPLELAAGARVLGRVALAVAPRYLLAAWLEEDGHGQRLRVARLSRDLRDVRHVEVARLDARGRASGMPRLRVDQGEARLVWVEVEQGRPRLRGAHLH